MGFFDTVRDKAGALAADAERAGKVTAAQARLVILQNDLRKAERELGHAAYALVERGDLDHPELAHAVERLRTIAAEVHAKDAEIAALRGESPEPAAAAAPKPPEQPATATVKTATGPVTVTSTPAPPAGEPVVAEAPPVEEPAVAESAAPGPAAAGTPVRKKARKPAAKPAAAATAKKAAATKSPAKKAKPKQAASAAPVAPPAAPRRKTKGGTGATAGATPKKSARPSSSGVRPAGKKRAAGT